MDSGFTASQSGVGNYGLIVVRAKNFERTFGISRAGTTALYQQGVNFSRRSLLVYGGTKIQRWHVEIRLAQFFRQPFITSLPSHTHMAFCPVFLQLNISCGCLLLVCTWIVLGT